MQTLEQMTAQKVEHAVSVARPSLRAVTMPPKPAQAPAQPGATRYASYFKRPFDIFMVLLGAPLAVPLIGLMICAIWLSGGQPLYRQERLGRGGKLFTMWKLRTMVTDADAALAAHLASHPAARAEWDANQKLRDDPRITRIGRVLRKISFDELPQIWNVLRGDMSLIGPRPMMVCQKVLYLGEGYYTLRPGITGLWQVSRRNDVSFTERANIDGIYARNVTFKGDLRILAQTLRVVFRGTGV
ncbi:sugar transferase [Yoonia sp. R2331]|uniref:sugar transferase n=1 Tax=Yoonia sp. R2331 TaxID=3237238 RepID=UPI0034E59DED